MCAFMVVFEDLWLHIPIIIPIIASLGCGLPSYPNNGVVSVSGSGYEAVATYTCQIGYHLVGSSNRTCQEATEMWSEPVPTCEREHQHDLSTCICSFVHISWNVRETTFFCVWNYCNLLNTMLNNISSTLLYVHQNVKYPLIPKMDKWKSLSMTLLYTQFTHVMLATC